MHPVTPVFQHHDFAAFGNVQPGFGEDSGRIGLQPVAKGGVPGGTAQQIGQHPGHFTHDLSPSAQSECHAVGAENQQHVVSNGCNDRTTDTAGDGIEGIIRQIASVGILGDRRNDQMHAIRRIFDHDEADIGRQVDAMGRQCLGSIGNTQATSEIRAAQRAALQQLEGDIFGVI